MRTSVSASKRALEWVKQQGGVVRSKDAIASGIYARTLTQLTQEGKLDQLTRGFYRLAAKKPLSNPDLVTVAVRVPKAVICLTSALSFHQLTTQIPHKVFIAIPEFSNSPRQE
jgi:predicted transcriptional regulator of viral defense system